MLAPVWSAHGRHGIVNEAQGQQRTLSIFDDVPVEPAAASPLRGMQQRPMDAFEQLLHVGSLHEAVLPYLAAVPRMLGFFVGMQLLPTSIFPTLVRNAIAIGLSMVAAPLVVADVSLHSMSNLAWAALLTKEALLGLSLGMLLGLPLAAFESLGVLLDTGTGQNSAATYDPISEHEVGPTASLLRLFATVVFMASGLFALALELVFWSFKAWPVSSPTPVLGTLAAFPLHLIASDFMRHVTLLAFPILAVLLALELAVGFMNRAVPQLNVFTVTMPMKASAALFILMVEFMLLTEDLIKALQFPMRAVKQWLQLP